jgi:hypothetical protein
VRFLSRERGADDDIPLARKFGSGDQRGSESAGGAVQEPKVKNRKRALKEALDGVVGCVILKTKKQHQLN